MQTFKQFLTEDTTFNDIRHLVSNIMNIVYDRLDNYPENKDYDDLRKNANLIAEIGRNSRDENLTRQTEDFPNVIEKLIRMSKNGQRVSGNPEIEYIASKFSLEG